MTRRGTPRRTPRARVLAVLSAGRRLADPGDPLGQAARLRLPAASRLSREGVELALTEHLEHDPSDAELDALLASSAKAPRCHVVMSANVCTAPLRALALALASSEEVLVKPSRRDPVVAELLVEALGWPTCRLVGELAATPGDVVHAYGADETLAAIAAALPSGVTLRGHGTGIGVAVVEAGDDLGAAGRALADDLVPFDGRGCLSPRLVVTGADATALGRALHEALGERGSAVPRGPLTADERAALRASGELFSAVGEAFVGPHHAVFVDPSPEALALAPPCRATVVLGSAGVELLAALAPHVASLGTRDGETRGVLARALGGVCPRARRSRLGHMQKPPLDGPVDLR